MDIERRPPKLLQSVLIACLAAQVLSPTHGNTFDGSRKGFFLSIGGGSGFFDSKHISNGWKDYGSTSSTSLKIGAGSTENLIIYFTGNSDFALDSDTELLGNSGISARYYIRPTAPSLFFSGSVGYERFEAKNADVLRRACRTCDWSYRDDVSQTGPGASVSIGYEFLKNWDLEASALIGAEAGYDLRVLRLYIGHAWY